MEERHEQEQYFFTPGTLEALSRFLARYGFVCLLCAPMLGRALAETGRRARGRFDHPLLLTYLRRRSGAVLGTFHRFALEPTGFRPRYLTVQESERNEIEVFGNLGAEAYGLLAASKGN